MYHINSHNMYPQNYYYHLGNSFPQSYVNPYQLNPPLPNYFPQNNIENNFPLNKTIYKNDQFQISNQYYISKSIQRPNLLPQKTKKIQKLKKCRLNKKVKPKISYLAKFFDPCQAPLITCQDYYMVQKFQHNSTQYNFIQGEFIKDGTQLMIPQSNNDPFIVFKHKRAKNRYRKYVIRRNNQNGYKNDKNQIQQQNIEQYQSEDRDNLKQYEKYSESLNQIKQDRQIIRINR